MSQSNEYVCRKSPTIKKILLIFQILSFYRVIKENLNIEHLLIISVNNL